MVAFSKWLGLRETNHHFFLGNEYRDPTIFLFRLNAEITIFLYSEYGPISIAEKKIVMENESIASTRTSQTR